MLYIKNTFGKLRNCYRSMSEISCKILLVGLPIILAELIYILWLLTDVNSRNFLSVYAAFPQIMEYIVLSFVLICGGAILFDIGEKETSKK